MNYLHVLLKDRFDIKFGKPYRRDYRQKSNYKTIFYNRLYHKINKYTLKYDQNTGNIVDLKSGKPALFFSFDESAYQYVGNYVKVYSLHKPRMEMDTNKYVCKAAGFYSLTPEGNDYITFMENSKKETIVEILKEFITVNPDSIIFLLIDNFPSHTSNLVKEAAEELKIELCFLPAYSPQLQPVEKVWYKGKRGVMYYKISNIEGFREMDDDEKETLLKEIVKKTFYRTVKSKTMWNKVDNNYIRRIIKKLHPRINSELEFEIIN